MATSYTMLLQPRFRSLLIDGTPNAGGKVYAYHAGTTTLATTYTTPDLSSPNTNPVVLDANGEADIWFSGPYKLVCQDAGGVQLWSADQLFGFKSDIFCSMPVQDQDKLIAWDSLDRKIKNSRLTLSAVETAIDAFNTLVLTNGSVVVVADTGDASPGTLNDKIDVSGSIYKSVATDLSGAKTLLFDVSIGTDLYTYENYNGF